MGESKRRVGAYRADVIQDRMLVASVQGHDKEAVEKDIQHYALVYGQDGPVTIKRNYKCKS